VDTEALMHSDGWNRQDLISHIQLPLN
jgi:hypothetical protein